MAATLGTILITFLSTTKPFRNRMAVIQANALASWRAAAPEAEIVLFGRAEGLEPAAEAVGAQIITDTPTTATGLPYFDGIVTWARAHAGNDLLCFLNADIILPHDFTHHLRSCTGLEKFLLVGQRHDLDCDTPVNFSSENSPHDFNEVARQKARLHPPSGIDYFVFTRSTWGRLPLLVPGRGGYDNWLIWHARRHGIPVIDATPTIFAVHQNHDYSHHPEGRKGVFEGEEARINHDRMKKSWAVLNILDATWRLTGNGLEQKNSPAERERYWDQIWRIYPEIAYPWIWGRRLYKWVCRPLANRKTGMNTQAHQQGEP